MPKRYMRLALKASTSKINQLTDRQTHTDRHNNTLVLVVRLVGLWVFVSAQ